MEFIAAKVDDYKVKEKYDGEYHLEIYNEDITFNYDMNKKYSPQRRLIKKIDTYKNKKYYCLYLKIKDYDTQPICYEDNELIDFRLINNNEFEQFLYNKYKNNITYINKDLNNLNLYYDNGDIYGIWNYKGIDIISKEQLKTINLFENDVYDNDLVTQVDQYLFIPNYNQEHFFNEVYIIDLKSKEQNKWDLNKNIYFESYIQGVIDKKIYLVDKKEEKQYEIDVIKRQMKIITDEENLGKLYDLGWKDITMNKLVSNELKFKLKKEEKFIVENDFLYERKSKTRLSNILKPNIITMNEKSVYYLSEDILYYYSNELGEVRILKKDEWKYNCLNKIFIYNE